MFGSRNFLFAKSAAAAPVISGKLFMWGDNFAGALGTGNLTYYSSPKQIGSLTTWSKFYNLVTLLQLCPKLVT